MAQTFRGRAQVEGVAGVTFNVILKKTVRSMGLTQSFDEQIVPDENGNDIAWKAYNEKLEGDLDMYLVGDTISVTRGGVAANAYFLSPYAVITVSGCEVTVWNSGWQNISGGSLNLENVAQGKQAFKVRRYSDSTQNTAATTTPT